VQKVYKRHVKSLGAVEIHQENGDPAEYNGDQRIGSSEVLLSQLSVGNSHGKLGVEEELEVSL
jgi:hypothetical protein